MRAREAFRALGRRRWVVVGLQLAAVAVSSAHSPMRSGTPGRRQGRDLRHADPVDLGIALAILAAYYLLFTIAWQRILRAWGLRIQYFLALQAEMASILAKYIPGAVWGPGGAGRSAAARRHP